MSSRSLTFCQWRHFRSLSRPWKETRFGVGGVRTLASAAPAHYGSKQDRSTAAKAQKKPPLKPVIGLEIHAQIHAKSKLFSGADSQFGNRVNSNVSHFDAAIPGTLPVINRRCVEAAVSTSLALGCKINLNSRFDRKHYFYADMPAGYQITQHFSPIARNGKLDYVVIPACAEGEEKTVYRKSIKIIQVQIEQDSGKSIHDAVNGVSLIDLNRAGQGLLEIVTAPDFEGSEDAVAFASELKQLLECLGVTDKKSGGGQIFRVDANVSLHREGDPLGVRTEIKNMNSLKDVRNAIDFEISRQKAVLDSGGQVINETLGFDRASNRTLPMRDKEIVTDYRFFPEPNLPPLRLSTSRRFIPGAVDVDVLAAQLPEFPEDVRQRLIETWRLTREQSAAIVAQHNMAAFFEKAATCLAELAPDLVSRPLREYVPLPPPPKPCPPEFSRLWPYVHPSLNLSATQRIADILLKRVVGILEDRGKSSLGDDLTIDDVPLTPRQVVDLASLVEEDKVSPAAVGRIVEELVEGKVASFASSSSSSPSSSSSSFSYPAGELRVNEVVSSLDLWMSDDRDWIGSLMRDRLEKEAKNLLKDNPKKNARAVMTVIGATIKASGLKANPLIVKSMVEEEVRKLRNT